MANMAERITALIEKAVNEQGVELWDIKFLKEGANWYLRVFIDKAEGINIDDCTNVSHAIDPIIDEADPIDVPYYLEVCSPGLERELSKPGHYEKMIGKEIKVKLYKARNGEKQFRGTLINVENGIVLKTENGEQSFDYKEISKANLCDFE